MIDIVLLAVVGFAGGIFGSMAGLGGGIFIIPGLTLFLGVPIHSAVAASLVAVVATSITSTAAFIRSDLTNVRLGMGLETLTVLGALGGGVLGASLGRDVLSGVFGVVMIGVAAYMGLRKRTVAEPEDGCRDLGRFGARYYDRGTHREVCYRPRRMWVGASASTVAGVVSGLLGVGGGFLKVPVLTLAMGVPARAAVSTSSFMIGMTASVGSIVYFAYGMIDPAVAVPVVLGVMAGAFIGSRLAVKIRSSVLVSVLAVILFVLSVQMILSAAGITIR